MMENVISEDLEIIERSVKGEAFGENLLTKYLT